MFVKFNIKTRQGKEKMQIVNIDKASEFAYQLDILGVDWRLAGVDY